MEDVKRDRLTEYERVERAIEEALALYEAAQTEYGMMPGVARRMAVREAMERWER